MKNIYLFKKFDVVFCKLEFRNNYGQILLYKIYSGLGDVPLGGLEIEDNKSENSVVENKKKSIKRPETLITVQPQLKRLSSEYEVDFHKKN